MPQPVTVWMVRLEPGGSLGTVRGTLRMDEDGVVFMDPSAGAETRVPFGRVRRIRRVPGSPVLVLRWQAADGGNSETAFYFAQPPPIATDRRTEPSGHEAVPLLGFLGSPRGQPSKRRRRRESIGYLAARSRDAKATIRVWAKEIRARTGA